MTVWHSHQQWMKVPVAPHPCQCLVLSDFDGPDLGSSDRGVMASHCCCNSRFPDDTQCEASFRMLVCYLYVFLGEMSAQTFCPFFKLGCFRNCCIFSLLHGLWIQVLYQIHVWDCFLPVHSLCFCSLNCSFTEQFLILMKSHLPFFFFF